MSETPSLWREFVWPLYDRREERSVMNVLKACGDYIKRLVFPDHVMPSTLIEMLNHCKNAGADPGVGKGRGTRSQVVSEPDSNSMLHF